MSVFLGAEGEEEEILADEGVEDSGDNVRNEEGRAVQPDRGLGGLKGMIMRFIGPLLFPFARFGSKLAGVDEQKKQPKPQSPKALVYIQGPKVYSCADCRTHLATDDEVMSRAFQGRGGRAFLFDKVVNVATGQPEDRLLITGLHTVADLMCRHCKQVIGWKYERAYEESQRYKEGKFIVEKCHLYREDKAF